MEFDVQRQALAGGTCERGNRPILENAIDSAPRHAVVSISSLLRDPWSVRFVFPLQKPSRTAERADQKYAAFPRSGQPLAAYLPVRVNDRSFRNKEDRVTLAG